MVRIKLARVGKSKEASFRVIVTDRQKDPFGDFLEIVGFYNPRSKPKTITLDNERILYWIGKGAKVTDSVHNLLVNQGVLKGPRVKVNRTTKNTKTNKAEAEEVQMPQVPQSQDPQTETTPVSSPPQQEVHSKEP